VLDDTERHHSQLTKSALARIGSYITQSC